MNGEVIRCVAGMTALTLASLVGCSSEEPSESPGNGGSPAGGALATGGASSGSGGAQAGTALGGALVTAGSGPGSGGASSIGAAGTAGAATSAGSGSGAGAGAGGSGAVSKSAGCGLTDYPTSGEASIDVAGTAREYILKIPADYDPNTAYRLVFGWHWRGGTASNVAGGQFGGSAYYGLEALANGTAIFVAPEGIDNGWANTGGRDIAFARAMVEFFESKLCIDQNRIFSTGFSYGGMMSNAIGCDLADVFRAIAPISGALYSGCTRSNMQPIAVWMAHGTDDEVVPLDDGKTALEVFLGKNGCGEQSSAVEPSPCVAYQGCAAGYPVHYCEFDGGHQTPSFASAAVWKFFSQF